MNGRRVRQMARLSPLAAALTCLSWPVLAQVAGHAPRSEAMNAGSAVAQDGQVNIGPRPFTSFLERLSSPVAGIVLRRVGADDLRADGLSATRIELELRDDKGDLLAGNHEVTIEVDGGARVRLPGTAPSLGGGVSGDIDRIQPGVQMTVRDGRAVFEILAPYRPADVNLRVSVQGRTEKQALRYQPELREMIAVGLLEARLRSDRFDPTQIVPARENDLFDRELVGFEREFGGGSTRLGARAAMYLKGKVRGDYLLTVAYDSDKNTHRTLFQDIDPNAFYPVYGDSSLRGVDAQSSGKLYVRLDRGRSYLLYGDFTTQDSNPARSLSQYNRSLPGLRAHHEGGGLEANAFAAQQSLRQVVDEFPGRGVSGPYAVSNPNGVTGSEKIEIVVRDRNRPALVLKATALTRSVDYEFEPFSGQILFKSPVPSVDDQLNPVSVRVTYEVEQGGERFWVYGADARVKLGERVTLGAAAARDENPASPYTIAGVNARIQLGRQTEVVAEVARSTSLVNQGASGFNTNTSQAFAGKSGEYAGQAARIEFRHADEDLRARAYVVRTDEDFNNPAAGIAGGRTEVGASGAYKISPQLSVNAEVLRTDDRLAGTRSDAASLGVDLKLSDRLTVGAGVRRVSQDARTLASQSPVACSGGAVASGAGYNVGFGISQQGNQQIDPATGLPVLCTPSTTEVGSGAPESLERTSLYGRVGFKLTPDVALNAEVQRELGDGSTTLYRLGADWQLAPKTRLYARLEHSRSWGGSYGLGVGDAANSFAVGFDTQYMQDGSVFSEYRLRDAANGRELQSAIGLRNGWRLAEGLRLTTSVERSSQSTPDGGSGAAPTVGGPATSSSEVRAVALGLEYTASELWKGSGRLEWREDAANTNWLLTLVAARKLDRDWTLLVRDYVNRISPAASGAADRFQNRFQLGFAYRPVDHNRFDALGLFERKIDTDRVARTDAHTDIVSLRANYHPSRPWWISGRYAYKQVRELLLGTVNDSYRAQLIGGRVTYDITNRWSLGALVTVLQGQGGARQHAYGLEVGYVLVDNLLLTLGYNWRGFRDDDLTGSDYTNRGWVLGVRYKFDEDLFRKHDPQANKTLAPSGAPTRP